MPHNLLKKYNLLLELFYQTERDNLTSLRRVFDNDVTNNTNFAFRGKPIRPTTSVDGEDALDRLFRHLTTKETDKATKKREFDSDRSLRLHWIRYHIEERNKDGILIFSLKHEKRTYILDRKEKYVIILEPLRSGVAYYLITAYRLEPGNFRNMMRKYERDGQEGPL